MVLFRTCQESDARDVRLLLERAFDGPAEAALVHQLRLDNRGNDPVPPSGLTSGVLLLDLVGLVDDEIVSHLALSRCRATGEDGSAVSIAALAPLSVTEAHQRQGIGSETVREAIRRVEMWNATCGDEAERIDALLVLGDPGFYSRFGFSASAAADVKCKWSGEYLQLLWLPGRQGSHSASGAGIAVTYADAFAKLEAATSS